MKDTTVVLPDYADIVAIPGYHDYRFSDSMLNLYPNPAQDYDTTVADGKYWTETKPDSPPPDTFPLEAKMEYGLQVIGFPLVFALVLAALFTN
jgi:hypothetical protein